MSKCFLCSAYSRLKTRAQLGFAQPWLWQVKQKVAVGPQLGLSCNLGSLDPSFLYNKDRRQHYALGVRGIPSTVVLSTITFAAGFAGVRLLAGRATSLSSLASCIRSHAAHIFSGCWWCRCGAGAGAGRNGYHRIGGFLTNATHSS